MFIKGEKHSEKAIQNMRKKHRKMRSGHDEIHVRKIVESKNITFLKKHGIAQEDKKYWRRYQDYKRSASKRNIEFAISLQDFKKLWQKPCNYCGADIVTIGLDRIDNNIGYQADNITTCCGLCNYMKRESTVEIFLEHCKKILKFNQLLNV